MPLLRFSTEDNDLNNNTIALAERLQKLERIVPLSGVFIANVALPAGAAVKVRHGLGRVPRGYFDAGMSGAAAAGYINMAKDATFLTLTATGFGATITLSLWVF
jgi:hypothetical protein